ncbi:EAL domain-containing protein [Nitrospirillum iridis]|uniref:Cyclic-di-GMP phosphodiesterase TipF (Flagellum assembly factor) n=1 Tax=Nitrospirillum iridis TaxID=765888 RepID=A0A7X0EF03_9PROT|nr:EAL domain-containing protein [Nitrospirillum iridis]MBB6252571.1 cyclic-di-GMP phosphodiesterase TipF (flagellum assembly factor) [Nitrospirillum iridis]
MNVLRHIIFAACYVAVAVAVALALPLAGVGVDRSYSLLLGLVVFVFGGLLHEFYARMEQAERLEHRLDRLLDRQRDVLAALDRLMRPSGTDGTVAAVVSDARMLRTLADQMPVGGAAAAGTMAPTLKAAPAAAPVPRTPMTPTLGTAFGPLDGVAPEDDSSVMNGIREALRSDRVDIFLQPIVSLPQRKHRFYEVFSRIRLEDGSYLTPDRYLGVAARHNLMAPIDNLLLFRCVQLLRETEKRHQNVGFFCNISAATLNDGTFMQEFVQFMGQHANLVQKIIFELSQADLMQGDVFATGFLDGLRSLGFRFSMDQVDRFDVDWDQLAAHEIRFVKLDAARLLDPDGRFANPDKVTLLKRQLDRNNIDLIVEKIETDQQLLDLLDLYIDFGQGYLFGEPRMARRLPS